ncbi:hypothetical protein Ahia01_000733400 [Argonauta hians]
MSDHSPEEQSEPAYSDSFESLSSNDEEDTDSSSRRVSLLSASDRMPCILSNSITKQSPTANSYSDTFVSTFDDDDDDDDDDDGGGCGGGHSNNYGSSFEEDNGSKKEEEGEEGETDIESVRTSLKDSSGCERQDEYSDTFESSGTSQTSGKDSIFGSNTETEISRISLRESSIGNGSSDENLPKDSSCKGMRQYSANVLAEETDEETFQPLTKDFERETENFVSETLKRFQGGKKASITTDKENTWLQRSANDFCQRMMEKLKGGSHKNVEKNKGTTATTGTTTAAATTTTTATTTADSSCLNIDPAFVSRIKLKNLMENMKKVSDERMHIPKKCKICRQKMLEIESALAEKQFLKWRLNELQRKRIDIDIENHLINVACIHLDK